MSGLGGSWRRGGLVLDHAIPVPRRVPDPLGHLRRGGSEGRPFCHGFELDLEGAAITFSSSNVSGRTEVSPLSVYLPDGGLERPELGTGDPVGAFEAELAAAVESVLSGRAEPRLSGELAYQALLVCLAEVESVRLGSAVEIS
ncbi:MAG: hypothetical protein U0835_14245 [Isosphaeraceae bacterium]